jgi:branched-chain amino acid transport system permease protein
VAAGSIALVYGILRSRHGLALSAIRDSEDAASSLGVRNFRTKIWIYVVAAFGTGVTGALIYFQKARVSPDAAFSVLDWTAYVVFIVVIGGIATAVMLVASQGLWGLMVSRFDVQLFPVRRRLEINGDSDAETRQERSRHCSQAEKIIGAPKLKL